MTPRKHLPILHVPKWIKWIISGLFLVAYRWAKNLKDLLVGAMLKPPQQSYEGTCQLGQTRFKTCFHIKMRIRFSSSVAVERFQVGATANCKTSIVIYLIECQKCCKPCFGETKNPLDLRLNAHRSDYNSKFSHRAERKHFNELGSTSRDLTIVVIKQMGTASAAHRKNQESFWIHTLWSLTLHGLNLEL